MRNFVTVVFDDKRKAYKGLHALWELDDVGEITVHGTAVVHRDEWGYFEVDTKETHPVFATAVGIGIGALLGVLAGPAGVAIGAAGGAAIGAAGGAAIGAATGAVVGGAVDVARSDTRQQEGVETGFILGRGQSAVIADVSEDRTSDIDTRLQSLGGTVHRRSQSSVEDDSRHDDGFYPYDDYLYPYEFVPGGYAPYYGW
jgi:uncharacterized membrane protein